MHWIEEWMRNECGMPQKSCRECRMICAPIILLARNTGTPIRIIERLIWDGWVTHPNFANAIAGFVGASPQQRDMIVPEKYRGQWKPSRRKKKPIVEMPCADASNRKWKDRPVVLIDRSGAEKKRFAGAQAAADYAGKGRDYIYSRCERRISQKTDEFARTEESFRWADEWDVMTAEERADDVRNRFRSAGKCTVSTMPRVYEYQGERHTIAEWARISMMPESVIRGRVKNGWSMEKAIKTPIRTYGEWERK